MGKIYTDHEIEMLQGNPNVKRIEKRKFTLTYECRLAIYEKWEKNRCINTIVNEMNARGLDIRIIGKEYAVDLKKTFKRCGRPQNGKNTFVRAVSPKISNAAEQLVSSGKFEYSGNGIRFTESFEKELGSKYPGQSIEDGLREAGIDPQLVGYQRIYCLKRRLEMGKSSETNQSFCKTWAKRDDETVAMMKHHPYVARASRKQLVFRDRLYSEASILLNGGLSLDRILEIYEIPAAWMNYTRRHSFRELCRHAHDSDCDTERNPVTLEEMDAGQKTQYLRIQMNFVKELDCIVREGFRKIGQRFPHMKPAVRRQVCEWFRDEVPRKKRGPCSLRGLLQQAGIPKSTYYGILEDKNYGEKYRQREERDAEDAEIIRRVIDYKGYPKGSRQVYMQMEHVTGKHMSRKKIMRIMQKNHWQAKVRKSNPGRHGSAIYIQEHLKPNLLKRRFRLHRPGEVFLTDVTYMKYGGHLNHLAYGSALIDSVTGRLYTFQISDCNDLNLVVNTLHALQPDQIHDVVKPMLHSDQGTLYLTDAFQELVRELGMEQSMSKRGNCWDNSPVESFFGHFKDECPYGKAQSLDELKALVSDYSTYYNEERGQWNRKRMSPVVFETWINNMDEEAFQAWQAQEEIQYEEMKKRAQEKAVEKARTLGV